MTKPEEEAAPPNVAATYDDCFKHLIGGAGLELEAATCLYADGIATDFSIPELLSLVEGWFADNECKPRIVLVEGKEDSKSRSRTMKWLRAMISDDKDGFGRWMATLQFFPRGRTTIDDTWRPAVYLAVAHYKRTPSAFFYVNKPLAEAEIIGRMQTFHTHFRGCSTYGFYFPMKFSPLGYYWGISVNPGRRRTEGEYAPRESRRLSHWRDNSQSGILSGGERRFFGACDGYVRDAYPLMLLSAEHLERQVGITTLAEVIQHQHLGTLEPEREKFLWQIPPEKLSAAQQLLDENDISLSGRRLE